MYRFAIKNHACNDITIGFLLYDEDLKQYNIELAEGVRSEQAPPILSEFIQRKQRYVGNEWSLRWVRQRVVPPERQNIGQILRENGMEYYDEFPLLIKNHGKSCQDDCYLEAV